MGINVLVPGSFTTVQDGGRKGYQNYGVSPSGPMDAQSFAVANMLVGNTRDEAALEATLMGPTLEFTADNVIALTGADMQAQINGVDAPRYQAVPVCAGDRLTMAFVASGVRSCIAFAGGLDVPLVMGSRATLAMKKLGGFNGRKLERGDAIGFRAPRAQLPQMELRRAVLQYYPADEVIVRVVLGPQDDGFAAEEIDRFFAEPAVITGESDRQGIRLTHETPLRHRGDGNIISDGITAGAIQVPPNGQSIIMMADHQTVGGYPKIGHVISIDLPRLAQALPGMRVRFLRVSVETAQELYLLARAEMDLFEERMRALGAQGGAL